MSAKASYVFANLTYQNSQGARSTLTLNGVDAGFWAVESKSETRRLPCEESLATGSVTVS